MAAYRYSSLSKPVALGVISAALALGACGKKAPDELPPAPGYGDGQAGYDPYAEGNYGQQPGAGYGAANDPNGPGSKADFMRSVQSDRIFFDTDRYNIDTADAAVLQSQAQWLMRYPNVAAVVEGHADERGTRDYNLALGERRATAAKQYLVSLGVPANRISTISYGKERPEAMGSNPEAWAKNRRAVTVTVR